MTEAAITYAIRKAKMGGCSLEQVTIHEGGLCTAETLAFASTLAEINDIADKLKRDVFDEAPRFLMPPRYLPAAPAPSAHHQQAPRERMPDDDMPGLIKKAQLPLSSDHRPEPDQGLVDRIKENMPWAAKNGNAHLAAMFCTVASLVLLMQRSGIA